MGYEFVLGCVNAALWPWLRGASSRSLWLALMAKRSMRTMIVQSLGKLQACRLRTERACKKHEYVTL